MTGRNKAMKKLVCLIAILSLCFWSRSSEAQSIVWEIKQHSGDPVTFKAEISEKLGSGFVPAGLSCDGKDVYILYIKGLNIPVSDWLLEGYSTGEETDAAVTARAGEGFFPAGFSRTAEKLYVFYIKIEAPMGEWKIITTTPDLGDVESTVRYLVAKGYIPAGITFFKDEYWTLVMGGGPLKPDKWLIEVYEVGDFKDKINKNIEKGFVPWGFEYSGGKRIDVLYLGFNNPPEQLLPDVK
jgi:hypothetical protein